MRNTCLVTTAHNACMHILELVFETSSVYILGLQQCDIAEKNIIYRYDFEISVLSAHSLKTFIWKQTSVYI